MEFRRQATEGGRPVRRVSPLRAAVAAGCAGWLVLATGCSLHLANLSFRVDKRLHFVAPKDRSRVTEPVTLRWTMRDFTIEAAGAAPPSRDAGYFAIFVDQAPIKPGQTLKAVAHGDRACANDPSCPSRQYLADRQVYTTTQTSYVLTLVTPIAGIGDKVQLHDVTIVLLDTLGHRIGESSWHVSFKLKKRTLT
jgi:hypothetical protein